MNERVTAPVDVQLEAYNERDIDRFMSVYCEETTITRLPATLLLQGLTAIRERYSRLFESSPALRAIVHERSVVGEWVVDHETVSGASMASVGEAVVAYRVIDGKIVHVFLMK